MTLAFDSIRSCHLEFTLLEQFLDFFNTLVNNTKSLQYG